MSQQLNYFNLIKFDINIAFNFIDKIIKKCLIKSFYYLYKQDKTIINLVNENNMTLMHQIEFSEKKEVIEDMIKLLITLDETILNKKNNEGETPLLYHAKNNVDICSILIKIIKEKNMTKLFYDKTNNNDTILHILSSSNLNLKLIKEIIYDNMDLLNEINKHNETAILISCINSAEDIYYLLNGIGADITLCDKYENSIEHYICLNEMCIGMAMQNKENIFGYTPLDYCKISPSYYYFIN
jgi:ankyrin repeat protein